MDNSTTLALKYRPTSLANLIGQESVTNTLINAFKSESLYQCLLFAGFYGCGKTSAARILAAMENCENGPTTEPCGKCTMCEQIFSGSSIDVKEVNAASANGIDDIRNLTNFVSVRPLLARVKYVILDECHALSRQAVESALKIFEEPPEGVRFVLCTTDLHKMKGTIQTRCMPFRFTRVPWQQISDHLKVISSKENIQADEASLKLAAKLADGSIRNGIRNLQLMTTYASGKPITIEGAQSVLGAIDDSKWFNLIDAILSQDTVAGMKIINEIFSKGQEVGHVMNGLTEHLRTLLVVTTCKNTSGLVYLNEEEKKRYVHQIGRLPRMPIPNSGSDDLVVEMISMLKDVAHGVSLNLNAQMLLEQYLIRSMITCARLQRECAKK